MDLKRLALFVAVRAFESRERIDEAVYCVRTVTVGWWAVGLEADRVGESDRVSSFIRIFPRLDGIATLTGHRCSLRHGRRNFHNRRLR